MIYFSKMYDVKTPTRGTKQSAGIDFYVPEYTEEFMKGFKEKNPQCGFNEKNFFVRAHERVLIPSGIKVRIPSQTALIVHNKSGVCTKTGLIFGADVIDSDYTGEIHLSLVNTTDDATHISYGQKIVQMILTPVFFDQVSEVTEIDLYKDFETNRGEGGFGSTGLS